MRRNGRLDVELHDFSYGGEPIRAIEVDGERWVYVADIARVLGYSTTGDVLALVRNRSEDVQTGFSLPGLRSTSSFVNRRGLNSILLTSRKPEVRRFYDWVTGEVLTEIEDRGSYTAPTVVSAEMMPRNAPGDSLEVLRAMVDQMIIVRDTAIRAEQMAGHAEQEARVANARIDAIEGRHDHYAALGWAKLSGWTQTDDRTLAALGRIAGTVGRAQGLHPGKAPHAHYGEVNVWPAHVWDEAARRFRRQNVIDMEDA